MRNQQPFKSGKYPGGSDPPIDKVCDGRRSSPWYYMPPFGSQVLDQWETYSSVSGVGVMSATDSGATSQPTDWYVTITNSGTITRLAGGVNLLTGGTSGNNTTMQSTRAITVAANKIQVAVWRATMDVVATGKYQMGFHLTGQDPIGTQVVSGAYWGKLTAGTGAMTACTAAASTVTSNTGFTAVLATAYDFGIVINGTTNVQHWAKPITTPNWTLYATSTTNLPAGSMRWTVNATDTSSAAHNLLIGYWNVAQER